MRASSYNFDDAGSEVIEKIAEYHSFSAPSISDRVMDIDWIEEDEDILFLWANPLLKNNIPKEELFKKLESLTNCESLIKKLGSISN